MQQDLQLCGQFLFSAPIISTDQNPISRELPEHQVCVRPSGPRYKRTTAAPQGPAWGTSSSDAKTDRQLLLVVVGTLILHTDLLDAAGTARDSRSIAVVGVDADEGLAAGSLDAADLDGALELLAAVAAGAVQLAEVLHGEVLDDHLAAGVVLDDLVVGVAGAAADDAPEDCHWRKWKGEREVFTLADVSPPDVLDGAGALAVDTLDLVGADNGVLEGGAVLEDEDGVLLAAFLLAGALDATAE
ncbi:hypothetical protein CNMCM8812_008062 [Aspergillus fumigatus]|nr:hypothetical protein CNMCM8812_008062 [Aspergillus fumigatus]